MIPTRRRPSSGMVCSSTGALTRIMSTSIMVSVSTFTMVFPLAHFLVRILWLAAASCSSRLQQDDSARGEKPGQVPPGDLHALAGESKVGSARLAV